MTTVYVSKQNGVIVGYFAGPQSGMNLEAMDDQSATFQAFLHPGDAVNLTDYADAVQAHVDATAKAREFNDGVTAATYLTSTIPRWKADAEAFVAWRDQVWAYSYGELAKVQNGQRPQPSIAAFITELPAVSWPDE